MRKDRKQKADGQARDCAHLDSPFKLVPSWRSSRAWRGRLAREATGKVKAVYKMGSGGTRKELMLDPNFVQNFDMAKKRIRGMQVRFVEEEDPVRQALLEVYVAVVLEAPYNDFDTH